MVKVWKTNIIFVCHQITSSRNKNPKSVHTVWTCKAPSMTKPIKSTEKNCGIVSWAIFISKKKNMYRVEYIGTPLRRKCYWIIQIWATTLYSETVVSQRHLRKDKGGKMEMGRARREDNRWTKRVTEWQARIGRRRRIQTEEKMVELRRWIERRHIHWHNLG